MKKTLLLLLVLFFITASAQEKTGLLFTAAPVYNKVGPSVPFFYKGNVPAAIDLSAKLPAVGDQGRQNSCVGWALGYSGRSYYNLKRKDVLPEPLRPRTDDSNELISPAFIYNLLNNGKNKGTSLHRALNLLRDTGACLIKTMPYDAYDWYKQPGEKELKEAKQFRIDTFKRIAISTAALKAELMANNPIICAAVYDQRYFNYGYNNRKALYLWDTITKIERGGGHAIVLVGYDDKMGAFKFINSWGTNWGNKGYGWISYTIIHRALREAYVIKPRLTLLKPHLPIKILPLPTLPPLPTANYFRQEEVFTEAQFKLVQQQLRKLVNDTLSALVVENISIRQDKDFAADQITLRGYAGIRNFNSDKYKVVVRFFFKDSPGKPVLSRNASYKLATGQAAGECETRYLQYDNNEWDIWQVSIPVSALEIPKGKMGPVFYQPKASRLIAEPVLFVDDFPLIIGEPFEFEVRY